MLNRHVILDLYDANIAHASLTCDWNGDLIDHLVALGADASDYDGLVELALTHGYAVPAWSARVARPCPECTLVATSRGWLAAA